MDEHEEEDEDGEQEDEKEEEEDKRRRCCMGLSLITSYSIKPFPSLSVIMVEEQNEEEIKSR